MGAGGGNGDLDQVHELDLSDMSAVGSLFTLCSTRLQDRPEVLQKVNEWLGKTLAEGARNVKIDTASFFDALVDGEAEDELDDVPLDRLIDALEKLVEERPKTPAVQSKSIVGLYRPTWSKSYMTD